MNHPLCHSIFPAYPLALPLMCCFSRPVEHVSNTQIFARPVTGGRQAIIYSMELRAGEDLAMILPIPVAQPAREDAVKFVSLADYPNVFAALRRGFPPEIPAAAVSSDSLGRSAKSPLKVVQVGSFNASFVPTVKDFDRLDAQFKLPDDVWAKLGLYNRFGFAVFKLKQGHAHIHPMAFVFLSAKPRELFFPTVHIHDGHVERRADFDHSLYCQAAKGGTRSLLQWEESNLPARAFVNAKAAKNLILTDQHVFRRTMVGEFANEDVLLPVA